MPLGSRTPGRVPAVVALAVGCRTQLRHEALAPAGPAPRPAAGVELRVGPVPLGARSIGRPGVVGRCPEAAPERLRRARTAWAGDGAVDGIRRSEPYDAALPPGLTRLTRTAPPVRRSDGALVVFTAPPAVGDAPGGPEGGSQP